LRHASLSDRASILPGVSDQPVPGRKIERSSCPPHWPNDLPWDQIPFRIGSKNEYGSVKTLPPTVTNGFSEVCFSRQRRAEDGPQQPFGPHPRNLQHRPLFLFGKTVSEGGSDAAAQHLRTVKYLVRGRNFVQQKTGPYQVGANRRLPRRCPSFRALPTSR
jgi:hypothetical protein